MPRPRLVLAGLASCLVLGAPPAIADPDPATNKNALVRTLECDNGETIVVVCHGGVVMASMVALGNLPMKSPVDLFIDNTAMTEWARGSTDPDKWRLVRLNDYAHVEAVLEEFEKKNADKDKDTVHYNILYERESVCSWSSIGG